MGGGTNQAPAAKRRNVKARHGSAGEDKGVTTESALADGTTFANASYSTFPQPNHVTSNLDLEIQKADHREGGSGTSSHAEKGRNSFVLKILTSKPLGLKILQAIFADPAPVAA